MAQITIDLLEDWRESWKVWPARDRRVSNRLHWSDWNQSRFPARQQPCLTLCVSLRTYLLWTWQSLKPRFLVGDSPCVNKASSRIRFPPRISSRPTLLALPCAMNWTWKRGWLRSPTAPG